MSMLAVIPMAVGTEFFYLSCCQCAVECNDKILAIYVTDQGNISIRLGKNPDLDSG
jgi:hypothetical protein